MIHISCEWISVFQWAGALSAAAAALLWLLASVAKMPPLTYADADNVIASLRKQGRLNSFAAVFAAIAATIQGFLIVTPTCVGLG
jgi:hypothetical protein